MVQKMHTFDYWSLWVVWCECVILSYKPNPQSPDSFLHRRCIRYHYSLSLSDICPCLAQFSIPLYLFFSFLPPQYFLWPINLTSQLTWLINPDASSPLGPTSHPWPTTTMFCNCTPKLLCLLVNCIIQLFSSSKFLVYNVYFYFYFLYKRY